MTGDHSQIFDRDHRELQDRFGTRPLADRLERDDIVDVLGPEARAIIEGAGFFFLSTVDKRGQPTVSYKGGAPGFVQVLDDRTLQFPSYDGNGMYYSTGNLSGNGRVGLLFIDFERPDRLRVHGTARISHDADAVSVHPGAQFLVTISVLEAFDNCPRYIHRMRRLEISRFVPDAAGKAPRPAWKRLKYIQDVMDPEDKRATLDEGGPLEVEDYLEILRRGED